MATTVTETARVTGAVNTLVRRRDGGWDAHNTDVRGIEAALAEVEHDGTATLLGGGATARSALLALGSLGRASVIRLAVRGDARPETLRLAVHAGIAVEVVPAGVVGVDAPAAGSSVSTLPPDGRRRPPPRHWAAQDAPGHPDGRGLRRLADPPGHGRGRGRAWT